MMQSLANYLIPTDWMQMSPKAKPKPPPCPIILEQMQHLIDNAPTDKARRHYQRRKTLYLEATNHA